ncbi:MAG: 50S ribosomal protein L11 methyltransferase [Acidobacteria bacterium]|nr:50S ribosomal protein L11 methyltransferase [Acidobacteriota bacterium]
MSWYAIDLTLAARAREAVEYALMEAGAGGTEVSGEEGERVRVAAYFDSAPELERVREALRETLRIYGLDSADVHGMSFREVAERDWLAEWKKNWRPVEAGERFLVAPPWSEVEDVMGGRIVIRVEPGMAFGPALLGATCECLVLSGILETQTDLVTSRLRELNVNEIEITHDGEWIAIVI